VSLKLKNICLFNSCNSWGGGEKWHFETAKNLTKIGHKVILCARPKSALANRIISENILHFFLKVRNLSFLNPFKIYILVRLFKAQKIDVIILGLPSDVKLAGIAAKFAGVRKIIYRRGSAVAVRNTWLNRFLYRNVITDIITNSEEIRRKFLERNKNFIPLSKIHLVYNGVELSKYFPMQSNGHSGKTLILGSAGRMVQQKCQWYLLEVAKILKEKNIDFKLKIAGIGPMLPVLKKQAAELNIMESVEFCGFIDDIPGFLNSLDIFLLTSLHEGSANILLETMACGKPIIAFNVSSIPEIITDGINGHLEKFGQCEQFAQKIIDLANNPELLEEFGMNGRQLSSNKFSLEQSLDRLQEIILS
jgi:glycosyltransferase involved in cell wall biosynthesis